MPQTLKYKKAKAQQQNDQDKWSQLYKMGEKKRTRKNRDADEIEIEK